MRQNAAGTNTHEKVNKIIFIPIIVIILIFTLFISQHYPDSHPFMSQHYPDNHHFLSQHYPDNHSYYEPTLS